MGKLRCLCDEVLQISGAVPNPIEWKIISDVRFDEFSGQVEAESVYLAAESLLRCPNCDRLWVYWDGFDREPTVYAPQT